MKKSKRVKPFHLDSPQACLNQLSHHQVSQISTFQNGFPDPNVLPSVASVALQSEMPEESFMEAISDLDVRLLQRTEDDSELDSAESDVDPLEHAGTFTTEEVSRVYLEKLQKLRSLYVGEFKRFTHLLKENKRQYLQALRTEKETMMSIHDQPKENIEERLAYEELKHLAFYHRHSGKEALLHKKFLDKKTQAGETVPPKQSSSKCIYSEGSWKCGVKTVPYSKYCFKHILQDDHQVLFKPCGSTQGGGEECVTPVIPLPHTPMCIYHTPVPSPLPLSEICRDEGETWPISSNPKIIDLSETSAFVISEIPPENVMEEDGSENQTQTNTLSAPIPGTSSSLNNGR
ncbi:KAT8 regulatory NSL complex subunit 2 [Armadillidium nasatum]|uniref:KAT8 regulatory NSL complex subunit 2 n=1 Tax=Armadillidium nasatum TaxID=96803 RepID=A0A5N5TEB1_9CRUS|nr:KAT8 regulatory NSL complex subunit 2 [Armadillidium nasatum]